MFACCAALRDTIKSTHTHTVAARSCCHSHRRVVLIYIEVFKRKHSIAIYIRNNIAYLYIYILLYVADAIDCGMLMMMMMMICEGWSTRAYIFGGGGVVIFLYIPQRNGIVKSQTKSHTHHAHYQESI